MKKEKSLNFLGSKWLIVSLFALGIMFFGSVDVNAQNIPWQERITATQDLRDTFAPGTAKYDIVQAAIEYLLILEENSATNPNYLNLLTEQTGTYPLNVAAIRKTHPSILANYSGVELAAFEASLESMDSTSESEMTEDQSATPSQKIEWILEANSY